jgi:hypothetical protein
MEKCNLHMFAYVCIVYHCLSLFIIVCILLHRIVFLFGGSMPVKGMLNMIQSYSIRVSIDMFIQSKTNNMWLKTMVKLSVQHFCWSRTWLILRPDVGCLKPCFYYVDPHIFV